MSLSRLRDGSSVVMDGHELKMDVKSVRMGAMDTISAPYRICD